MAIETMQVTPVTPAIGGEINGLDLGHPLDEETRRFLHEALVRYQVLFFRDQHISLEAQKAVGALFGELVAHPNDPGPPEHPEVLIVHADEGSKRVAGESWHSDVSCDPEPPMGSILRVHTLPATGGDTLFASMYAAFEALSPPLQRLLEGLSAEHDGAPYYRSVNARIGRAETGREYPHAVHPVVRTHPVSGRKALFVNRMFTTRILDLTASESQALLGFLFDHIQRPEFQCRFRWQQDSVAFWDNRCVQHMAIWDYWPQTRSGYRVTIKGDRPA